MRATINSAFTVTGRGTVIAVSLLQGQVRSGDTILCPMRSGDHRKLLVQAVEFVDNLQKSESEIGLIVGSISPEDVTLGGVITAVV